MVRVVGVEPTCLAAQEPKSCASANSAIPAYNAFNYISLLSENQVFPFYLKKEGGLTICDLIVNFGKWY